MLPILTHDGSNDAVWSKEVPFGCQNDYNLSFGGMQPKNRQYFGVSLELNSCRMIAIFKYYIELIPILNLTITSASQLGLLCVI